MENARRKSTYLLAPNTYNRFGLQETRRELLPAPFDSDCVSFWNQTEIGSNDDDGSTEGSAFSKRVLPILGYSRDYCQLFCALIDRMNTCGCFDSEFDEINLRSMLENNGLGNLTVGY